MSEKKNEPHLAIVAVLRPDIQPNEPYQVNEKEKLIWPDYERRLQEKVKEISGCRMLARYVWQVDIRDDPQSLGRVESFLRGIGWAYRIYWVLPENHE